MKHLNCKNLCTICRMSIRWVLFEEQRRVRCEWDEYSAILESLSEAKKPFLSAARCFSASDRIYSAFFCFVFIIHFMLNHELILCRYNLLTISWHRVCRALRTQQQQRWALWQRPRARKKDYWIASCCKRTPNESVNIVCSLAIELGIRQTPCSQ